MTALGEPLHLQTSQAGGAIHAHGAHVLSWVPAGHHEVLFLARGAVFDSGAAIRGGIPVVFPWFGPGRTPGMSPSHGFARTALWHLVGVDDGPDIARAEFRLTNADATSAWFPAAFEATLTVAFGRELEVALAVRNTGAEPFSYEDALHAYFRVSDIEQIGIDGLDGAEYFDKTAPAGSPPGRQSGPIAFAGEVDRVYDSTASVRIADPGWDRAIAIAKEGSGSTIVWNPWAEVAGALPDLEPGEWRGFVCVEVGNARERAVELGPGVEHHTVMRVAVEGPGGGVSNTRQNL